MASVLQITPHAVFPPRGGRRAFFFLREISRVHDVCAILPQSRTSLEGTRDGYLFPERVEVLNPVDAPPPKTVFDRLPRRIAVPAHDRWLRRSLRGPASSMLLDSWHLVTDVLSRKRIDVVIFDHVGTALSFGPLVRRLSPDAVLTLNAHNVDSELLAQEVAARAGQPSHSAALRAYRSARYIETHLGRFVDAFWACSEIDRRKLEQMNDGVLEGFAIPNGIAAELLPYDANPNKRSQREVLFCGALNYPPNRRGLEWFHADIWPSIRARMPELRLRVIGYGAKPTDYMALRNDRSVNFVGEVDTVPAHYHETSLSVVPLLEGSGTRVKILEAMSLGSPVVSTRIGAEGIDGEHGRDFMLADEPEAFANAVLGVLADPAVYASMRRAGRQLVDSKYDWRKIGTEIDHTLDLLVSRRGAPISYAPQSANR